MKKRLFTLFSTFWAIATIVTLTSCGGGGSSNSDSISPDSLNEVRISIANAFELTFEKVSGEPGNETGIFEINVLQSQLPVGQVGGTGSSILYTNDGEFGPVRLTQYTYTRVGRNGARITLNATSSDLFPPVEPNEGETINAPALFYGSTQDVLIELEFSSDGRFITGGLGSTSNIPVFIATGERDGDTRFTSFELDADTTTLFNQPVIVTTRSNGNVSIGSNTEIDPRNTPSRDFVPVSLDNRIITFYQNIDFSTTGFPLSDPLTPPLTFQLDPTVDLDGSLSSSRFRFETGNIFDGTISDSEIYGYNRTFGREAELLIEGVDINGSLNNLMDLRFIDEEFGEFTTDNGTTGFFEIN